MSSKCTPLQAAPAVYRHQQSIRETVSVAFSHLVLFFSRFILKIAFYASS